uniref:Gramicidin S synthase 2 n=1 Tax=Brevibacillus brevis TaxID=1393 RepID=GRSB_BREBE|nr:RecName: Full=Gramicidin S synthase 2; AltName: Full=Gramicidin S synthase II; Includes: RecName: Full=ATP-dependent proline adenylase; Short=ProA; AltName: Full=Proline activase; Includes: RecName: Full=ATP-dependent valine adenylase; Short=ValA; AltName: Full=Valine activase; Includes: RecName: Full=ATP-dependent ornithine adenylase; Short=OrnA; AltName: Full=Ornithine activase; Includes: RecName: Full=ATP-dependent leucine adenylase; Short=LeuA; AltName: Full=Leucine activase [Brevibacillus b
MSTFKKEHVQDMYRLSPMQEGMLFHALLDKDKNAHLVQMSIAIEGIVDVELLSESLNILIDRYDVFRTTFLHEKIKQPLQVVLKERPVQLQFKDISSLDEEKREQAIEQYKYQDGETVFDLTRDPLMRVAIFQTGKVNYQMIWSFHHILMDGWCFNIIFNDLFNIYLSLKEKKPLQLEAVQPYKQFIKWLEKQDKQEALRYWKEHLMNYDQSVTLPKKKAAINNTTYEPAQFRFAFDKVLTQQLLRIANQSQVTLNIVFQTIWGIVLQKYNSTNDVVYGSVVSGRPSEISGIEKMVGLFINTLPLRIQTQKDQSFIELVKTVHQNVLFSQQHEYFPLYEIQNHTELKQNLIDHIMVIENYPLVEELQKNSIMQKVGFTVRDVKMFEPTNYDMTVMVLPRDEISVRLDYNAAVYDIDFIRKIEGHMKEVALCVANNPHVLVQDVPLLTKQEKQHLLVELHDSITEYPDKTIHQLFTEQVEKTPEHVAVVFEDEKVTYRELHERSNQLARFLREKGVKKESIIGIMMERSVEMIVGILGILKAGGAFVPIDPEYPKERIGYMLDSVRLVLTQRHLKDKFAFTKETIVIEDPSISHELTEEIDYINESEDLFYIIYTSGTTGKPKGVMLEHKNIVNLLHFTFEKTNINFSDKVLQYTTCSFDVCYQEIFSTLLSGGQLYLIRKETQRDVEQLFDLVKRENIEVLSFPVAFLKFIFNEREFINRFPTCVKHIITAGEQLVVNNEFKRYLHEHNVHLHNHYGPSETHVVTTYTINPEAEIPELPPIGKPISNTWIYILDQEQQLQPQGIVGELYISGANVGRGYLNNQELTAEKFFADPFRPNERMYRTGDLARWLPDGNIEFLGRADHQVKIRGHRIELGEIEAQLLNCKGVKEAVVIDKADDKGGKYLCAYVVMEVEVNDSELREYLGKALPDYMIPSFFVPLDQLPLTPNGKIDRKSLPNLEGIVNTNAKYVVPTNELEEKLAKIWEEVLGISQIGIQDNFFSLGGHSLKAITLISRMNKECNVDIPLRLLFEAPTIQEISNYINGAKKESYVAIQPVPEQEYYPVSSVQKRMFILNEFDRSGTAYNLPGVMFLDGKLNYRQLEAAVKKLVERHEALRTSFHSINGEPVQRVHQNVELQIAYSESTEDQVERIIAEFMQPFALEVAPLLRVGLVKLEAERHLFIMDMHHIISDGVSMQIMIQEIADLYKEKELPTLGIQYKDFTVWHNRLLQSDVIEKQEAYWLNVFTEEIPVLNLPTDYPRPTIQSFDGKRFTFSTGKQLMDDLYKVATETGTTLYMVLLAAYNVFLSKYSGQDDIVVGTPIAGRSHADVENMLGMFVNTLAIRSRLNNEDTFKDFLANVKQTALHAYENPDYPFDTLVEKLGIQRDLSRNPLFDTMFVLQNTDRKSFEVEQITITPYVPNSRHSKFDLTLEVSEEQNEILLCLEYCTKLFTDKTVERMAGHFLQILHAIVGNPTIIISEIEILSEEEKQHILFEFNDTKTTYPHMQTIQGLFEEQVEKTPDHVAVGWKDQALTYRELNERANQVARVLRQKGVQPDNIVGLLVERSPEMLVGIMGILKAGGAYLPLDPEYPADRISYMIQDCGVRIMLTQQHLLSLVHDEFDCVILDEDSLYKGDSSNLAPVNQAGDLAYIMYTSGSTGKPKGVMVEHRNVIRLVKNTNYVQVREDDRIIQTGAIGFDALTFEVFGSLLHGAELYPVTKDVLLDAEKLHKFLQANQITIMWLTSPLFNQLSQGTEEMFAGLRSLIVGGDALSPKHINNVKRKCPNLTMWNGYGPTENTTFSTCFLIDKEYDDNIPIGKAISNSTVYIMDRYGQLQPVGVPGELCVGGDGVARGYMNQPALTEEKFVPNPFAPGERMYRTGDLARWLPDGTIEYLGRIDQQVKIRGYRIEPGEIETLLVKHKKVKESVIMVVEDNNGQKALCAYYVPEEEVTVSELREYIAKELPVYMVPAYFVQIEQMPLTQNGKVNRSALPKPDGEFGTATEYVAPSSDIEMKLAEIWHNVLGVNKIGVLDNFFELGGHSLRAMTMISQVHKEFDVELPLKVLFETPTISALAQYIADGEKGMYLAIQPVTPQDYYPVSSAQKRMYILYEFEGAGITYNVPNVMFIEGKLDYQRFEYAIKSLINRHEALRTSFYSLNGEPVQRVHQNVELQIAYSEAKEDEIEQIVESFVQPFDLEIAPALRVGLVKLASDRHLFLMDMHHIISDGVSMQIITKEIADLYKGKELAELHIQYKDFAVWQNEWFQSAALEKQKTYWLNTFAEDIPVLNLSTDYPRPTIQSFEGDIVTFSAGKQLAEELKRLATETGTTLYMLLLAAYNVLLHKYSGQEEIVVGTPIAGRSHADVENIVGMFVNTLALKNTPIAVRTFHEFLLEVKQNALEAFENQDYPFENLIEKLQVRRDLSRNPLFDTMFSLSNIDEQVEIGIEGLSFSPYEMQYWIAKFDISFDILEKQDDIQFYFNYCTNLFKKETIERLATHFMHILQEIVINPEIKLCEINMLSEEEQQRVLYDFNGTDATYATNKIFHELFEEQVEKTPDHIAVIDEREKLSYQELNAKANQLARVLRQKGVQPNSMVGIMVDRSLDMIVGMLGVLKAGGAYVPIDIDYPQERISYMMEDSGAALLLTQQKLTQQIAFSGDILYLDQEEWLHEEASNLEPIARPQDIAYIIYTSGTTGKPKGVMIEHQSYVNVAMAWKDAYRLDTFPVRLLQMASFAFDVSAGDFARALLTGGQLIVCPNEVKMDPASLYAIIKKYDITIFEATPALVIPLMEYIYEQKLDISQLQILIVGSDSCSMEDFKTLVSRFGSTIRIVNSYGVTEACIDSSYYEQPLSSLHVTGTVPIGKPYANMKMYIMNQYLQIQPVGVIGELCIGGAGVARGYLNRPDLTAEKFVPNPFVPGEKLYRTGDLARWMPDGNVEFLGRNDHQVKIRGIRIELGEIEAQLRKHDSIKEATVIAREDHMKEKYLCAYMVTEGEVNVAELRAYLATDLPAAMIPSYFVSLEAMPLTANGKIDKRSLPEPDGSISIGTEYVAPRTMLEGKLEEIWKDVLGLQRVGIHDDFFTIGGHSLKAMAVISQVHKECQTEVPLRVLFETPTIQGLAKYIEETDTEQYMAIQPVSGQDYYPVSSAQKRMFIVNQFDGVGISYNMPSIMLIEGKLERTRLESAFKRLIERHESLRTSFEIINGKPVQKIHEEADFNMSYQVASNEQVEKMIDEFIQPFDLSVAPLLRVELLKLEEDRHVLIFDMHHIISDGISSNILMKELGELYQGNALPELRIQYKDFAVWQNEWFQSEAFKKQEEYWVNVFADERPILDIPTDYPRPMQQSFDGAQLTFGTGKQLMDGLYRVATETGTTLYMVLLAAYNVLLSKYSGQEDIIVGTPIVGRSHTDLENIVGMFVNTLAMRNKPEGEKTFKAFVSEIKQNALAAFENQDYPFEELIEKLEIQRDLSRNPLFDTLFSLQNIGEESFELAELTCKPFDLVSKLEHAKFDLSLVAVEKEEEIAFGLQYCTKLYKEKTVEQLAQHFIQIVKAIVENPDVKLSDIDMLSEEEKKQIMLEFNDTKIQYPQNQTIQELFEEQVKKTPEHIAIVWEGQALTYHELNIKANQLARVLREKGVTPNHPVAIMTERSLEMIVGIFSILKAGGAYVPIDPAYPQERIQYLLEDSGATLLLTQSHVLNKLPVDIEWLDLTDEQNYVEDGTNLPFMNQSTDLAYIIYTSGTTGKPKGVMIEHQSIINCLQWRKEEYEFGPGDTALQVFSFAFDGFVASLFAPILAGATSVLPKEEEAKDPVALKKLIASEEITHYYGVPSLFSAILDVSSSKDLQNLRCVTLGGEKLPAQIVKKIKEKNKEIEVNNEYGPTENSVVTTIMRDIQVEQEITIGCPLSNVDVYIVNCNHQLQPVGVVGELCIGGQGLARGYLNKPELTADKFVVNPFVPGERMYKTGDLAKWRSDGMIEYVGRVDEQVKVRGYRIELGEIESAILEYEKIKEAVVIVSEHTASEQMLCAYIVGEEDVLTLDLRSYLAKLLPSYMIPNYFIQLDSIPLTPNGKVDRKALPEPQTIGLMAREYVAPRNEIEAQLVLIWQEVLGIELIGITDNFFELGGHSLKATLLVAKIYEYMQIEMPLNVVFKHSTIMKIAEYITHQESENNVHQPILVNVEADREALSLNGEKQRKNIELPILLNEETDRNVFLFAPIGAQGVFYKKLAEQIPTASLYGFDFIEDDDRIQQYIESMIQTQSDGQYVLIGYSSGGNLAFEVAKEMERQGYSVSDLVLFDVYWKGKVFEQTKEEEEENIKIIMEELRENPGMFNMTREDFELYFANEFVKQSFTRKMRKYMSFYTQLVNYGEVEATIHLIQAEFEEEKIDENEKADEEEKTYLEEKWNEKAWNKAAKRFVKYNGYGAHSNMLGGDGLERNSSILKQILQGTFVVK